MKTVEQTLDCLRTFGVACGKRTLWKYHEYGLLPEGQKSPGGGNRVYFPDETIVRIWMIHFLTESLDFKLSELSKYRWPDFEWHPTSTLGVSREFVFRMKNKLAKSRQRDLHNVVQGLMKRLPEEADVNWSDGKSNLSA
jgi:DNA-binding transcriptional MerR regulator